MVRVTTPGCRCACALAGLVFACVAAGCASAPAAQGGSASPADELARAVFAAAGGGELGSVGELEFHFVVYDGGAKKSDVYHRWDLRAKRDHVTWKDREGTERDGIIDLDTRRAQGTVNGAADPDPTAKGNLAERLYGRWINDTYWLILPLKVLDPGVHRTLEPPRGEHQILKLTFDKVGLTPGDTYWLFVDARHRITRWEMVLEDEKPPPASFTFEKHERIGPLTLALDHASEDGKRHITFEGVVAHPTPDPSHFRL